MEKYLNEYTRWSAQPLPEELRRELETVKDNPEEIYDRFCKTMRFGTSGLRGKMGAGTNRINEVILCRATRAISRYLRNSAETPAMAIGYDTRLHSKDYAQKVAETFARCGVNAYLFSEPTPVPVVSFAVRHLALSGGIMITASHNTKEYNGYKVYDRFGNQIDEKKARLIESYMDAEPDFPCTVCSPAEESGTSGSAETVGSGTVFQMDDSVKQAYLEAIAQACPWWSRPETCREALQKLRICYTPLNGSGMNYVPEVLRNLGVEDLLVVQSQKEPDGEFPTCPSPNPEYPGTFAEALRTAAETSQDDPVDLILATDPDSDRLGIMVRNKESFVHLNGNQIGEILFAYVCSVHQRGICGRNLSDGPVMIKSLVSSPLTEEIAAEYGVQVRNVFTGFKNIAAEMERLTACKEKHFLFGFEESLGYLYGDYTRDKDGIMAAQLICLAASELASQGKNLVDGLETLYRRYGYCGSETFSVYYQNEKDRAYMEKLMRQLFEEGLKRDGFPVRKETCYRMQNVYCADLAENARIIVRPSGTELKLKTYIFTKGKTAEAAETSAKALCSRMRKKWKVEE